MPGYSDRRKIGEHDYIVSRFGFSQMLSTLSDIGRLVNKSVESLVSNIDSLPVVDIIEILTGLISKFDSDIAKRIRISLGEHTQVNGSRMTETVQELHFSDNPGEFFQWLGFALEVQYKDFFQGLVSTIPEGQEGTLGTLAKAFRSRSTSTG